MKRIVKKPDIRRQEIISAAKDLFFEKDYVQTTIQDVMQKLGIAKGTIYHYFKSKEELLDAVIEDLLEAYLTYIDHIMSHSDDTALGQLSALINASNVSTTKRDELMCLHRPGNIMLHTRLLAVTISRLAMRYRQVIEKGCREGVFDVEHPLETAELLLAGIQFLLDEGCYPWSKEEIERRKKAIPSLLEAQLRTQKGIFKGILRS